MPSENLTVLEQLIEEDFGYETNGDSWGRSIEHSSLVVDRKKGIFYWNAEDIVGDAFVYLTKIRNLSYQDAKDLLRTFGTYTGTFIHQIKDSKETVVYPRLVDLFHNDLMRKDKTYFYRRTINDSTISRFKLGCYNEFYTIPIYQDGIFRQIQLRKDNPKVIRNFYKGIGPLLFNSDIMKVTDKIVFVEAPTSCLVLNQNGIPCVSMNTGAEGFQEEWYSYFIHQKEIYVLFDNDKAGEFGAKRVARILGQFRTKIYTFKDFEEKGYDANDFFIEGHSKEELLEILDKKTKYLFELEQKGEPVKKWMKKGSF